MEIARRAEELGFSTVATIGRIAYPTYEELITLAAAAGATERIELMTDIMLAPAREPLLLAKQAATLDQLSGGRFVLGVGVGARPDDYAVTGLGFKDRGQRFDMALDVMHRVWRGEAVRGTDTAVAPKPVNGHSVPMLFGGRSDQSVVRTVKYGIGYTQGGGTPEGLKAMMDRINAAWREAGREGRPQYRALVYYALGDEVHAEAQSNVMQYYGDYGSSVWQSAVKTASETKGRIKAFEAVGCDEVLVFMTAPALKQVDRLADAVL